MTDKEIIKALECLISGCFDCNDGCKESKECPVNIISCALDLIKRLKREHKIYKNKAKVLTERLETLGNPLQDAHYKIAEQQAEIERLTKIVEEQHEGSLIAMEVYKNEAIKEFAERFRKKANMFAIAHANPTKPLGYEMDMEYRISKWNFDNLVKEMVGDVE